MTPAAPDDPLVLDPARSRRATVLRAALLVVAVAFAAAALVSQWSEVAGRAEDLSLGWVAVSFLATSGGLVASFVAWRTTLAGLGAPTALRPAGRIFFVGQLGKYVPGSIWALVGQMELGRAAGIRRDRMATAGILVLVISLAAALGLGTLAVPALVEAGAGGYGLLVLAAVPLAVGLHPRVLGPGLDWLLRLARRPPLDAPVTGATVAQVLVLSVASNGLLGLAVWALARDLGADEWRVLPLAVGGYALAAAASLVVVPLPAGIGLREAVLVALLAPVLEVGGATLVAVAARLVIVVADLGAAGVAASLVPARPGSRRDAGT